MMLIIELHSCARSLAHDAENKSSEGLETEICKALEEGLARILWVAVENVIVAEE